MRTTLCARTLSHGLVAVGLALVALAFSCQPCPADERAPSYESALARANACVAIAKVTAAQPCATVECQLAQAIASKAVDAAKSQTPTKPGGPVAPAAPRATATLSADGRTLTDRDGKVYQRMPNGVFASAVSNPVTETGTKTSGGCYTVNGQTYCPYKR